MTNPLFNRLFPPGTPGYLNIWCKTGAEDSSKVSHWFDSSKPGALQEAQETAECYAAIGWNVYFGTCPAKAPKGAHNRITQADVSCVTTFFMDFDTQLDPKKRGKNVPVDIAHAVAVLDALPYPPTMIVVSGHGAQSYWLLKEPLTINTPADLAAVKASMLGFARAVAKVTGFSDLDTGASEPARVLRVPGTFNYKYGGALPVYIVDRREGPEYTLDELRAFIDQVGTAEPIRKPKFVLPDVIEKGTRDTVLTAYAGALRARGLEYDEILEALIVADETRCTEPKGLEACERIARSISRKPAGPRSVSAEEDFGEASPGNELATFKPDDYSDAGNAAVFVRYAAGKLLWANEWYRWTGCVWEENVNAALGIGKAFTSRMLAEARRELLATRVRLCNIEGAETVTAPGALEEAKKAEADAHQYLKFAIKTRNKPRIDGFTALSKPALEIPNDRLNADPFILNSPAGMIDLRTGRVMAHDPGAFCTGITTVSPSEEGRELWAEHLRTVSCGDMELVQFLQAEAGAALIGRVFQENLLIALGGGKNGKSTHFNAQLMVLGPVYGGTINPEVLTTDKRNAGNDLAAVKGKRLLIAGELEEGKRLSASVLKRLTSTDPISAERKFHDPETFYPTHSTVLYTNFMPRLGSLDVGTTRRIKVVPFNAIIPADAEKKNYTQFLYERAGGAILAWMIEGAQMFITNGFQLPPCIAVDLATKQYFTENDWCGAFLEECCIIGKEHTCGGAELYAAYCARAEAAGEYRRHNPDFAAELEKRGFTKRRGKAGVRWEGLTVRSGVRSSGSYPAFP